MLRRFSFGFRLFLYLTPPIAGLGLLLPAWAFHPLAAAWCGYTALIATGGVVRHGWFRGLRAPTAALTAVAVIGGPGTPPLCLSAWIIANLLAVCLVSVRSAFRRAKQYYSARFGHGRIRKRQLVSVAVRANSADVSAADVLAQFGFGKNDDDYTSI